MALFSQFSQARLASRFEHEQLSVRLLKRSTAAGLLTSTLAVIVTLSVISPNRVEAGSTPAGPLANSVAQSVSGRVIGPGAGLPVAGAQVYLLRRTTECMLLPTHPQMVRADANGRFTFTQVHLGTYVLWAESGNRVSHLTKLGGERVSVTAAGVATPLTLRLTDACRFRITVRAKADGRPLAKAAVRFAWPDIERRFDTDANGVAIVEGVRPQEETFEARADGYAIGMTTVVATQPGTSNEVGLLLAPGGQIRGKVRDADGRPITGVGVDARPAERYVSRSIACAKTDHDGRFVLDNVPLGETLQISVDYENRWQGKTVLLGPDKRTATVDLSFDKRPDTGSVVVHVTGSDIKPIAGARVSNPSTEQPMDSFRHDRCPRRLPARSRV